MYRNVRNLALRAARSARPGKQFEALVHASADKRYRYWVKRVADSEVVWSLGHDDGWVLAAEDDGTEAVPVWSHPEYAEACAAIGWKGNEPKSISLDDWIGKWLPGIKGEQRLVSVFPTPNGKGVFVSPDRVEHDLKDELEQYE